MLVLLAAVLLPPLAAAQTTPAAERSAEEFFDDDRNTKMMLQPAATVGTAITPAPGIQLPLDGTFRDHRGRVVRLGDYFDGKRPVLLTFGYHSCPLLCPMIHRNLATGMQAMAAEAGDDWLPGEQYRVVSLSIEPRDTPKSAAALRAEALAPLGDVSEDAWDFLVPATPGDAAGVAQAAGFNYRRVPNSVDFAHDAGAIVVTPEGVVSGYLFGVNFEQQATTLRWSLITASDGELGSIADHFAMYCYDYTPAEGTYSKSAMRIMRVAGAFTVVVMIVVLAYLVTRDARRRAQAADKVSAEPASV